MDWQIEVINLIVLHFKSFGIHYTPPDTVHRCLIDFMNLEMKLIKPAPRTIYKSKELKSRSFPIKNHRALKYIENKIAKGENIVYHQSKQALNPSFNDLLLNNWVVHHFHLSDTKANHGQKFYDRDKYLLFAIFSESQAFLIDVRPHGISGEPHLFAEKELLEIIDSNWPSILKVHSHDDAAFLCNDYSAEERKNIWKKGYSTTTVKINGKIVINPGIGITCSGHNLHAVKRANEVVRYLQESLMEIQVDEEAMKEAISRATGEDVLHLDIAIRKLEKWPFFAVFEKNSQLYIEKKY